MWKRVAERGPAAMGKTRKSFYAVRVGRSVGVYNSWEKCRAQVDRYPGAVFKGFMGREEAETFVHSRPSRAARESYRGDFHCSRPHYSTPSYSNSGAQYSHVEDTEDASSSSSSSFTETCYDSIRLPSQDQGSSLQVKQRGLPVVYSDGCCFNNGRRNAQAGVGVYWGEGNPHNVSEKLHGHPTNQRAEIVSACRALETAVSQGMSSVEVRTDSSYTIKAVTQWIDRWKSNGWQTVGRSDVKNKEDIQRLDQLCQQIRVTWTHVPGHQGIVGNEAADQLAKAGSQKP